MTVELSLTLDAVPYMFPFRCNSVFFELPEIVNFFLPVNFF